MSRGLVIGLSAVLALAGVGVLAPSAPAGIDIRIPVPKPPGLPLPPLLFPRLPDPRDLIPIPNLKAFFVPDINIDIVFEDGYWWTPQDGHWHRSRDYRGPYIVVPREQVSHGVVELPPRFRTVYSKEKRIPYGQWKKMHGGEGHQQDRGGNGERDSDRGRDRDHKGEGQKGKQGKGKQH